VQVGQPLDLLAVLQRMGRRVIVAMTDEVRILAVGPDEGRRVAVLVLVDTVALALDPPHLLAVLRVDADDDGRAVVDELEVQPVLEQRRRRVYAELVPELAVTLLGVEAPDLLAVQLEGGELAVAGEGVDAFAVRRG